MTHYASSVKSIEMFKLTSNSRKKKCTVFLKCQEERSKSFYKHEHYALAYTFMTG